MKFSVIFTFLLCGGISALFNIASRCVFSLFFPYWLAIVFAYGIGMITAFTLFKFFVFNASKTQKTVKEASGFFIINMGGLFQTLLISLCLNNWVFPLISFTFYPQEVAHIIGLASLSISSYVGHKYLTFRHTVIQA